jgi:hypothetical protein
MLKRGERSRSELAFDRAAEDAEGEVLLEADDVGAALQFLHPGQASAGDPDFKFGVGIEGAGGLHAELRDALVEDAVVGGLRAGEPLLIDQDQAVVGKDEEVAEDLETLPDGFARHEHGREFLLNLRDIDLRGVSEQAAE